MKSFHRVLLTLAVFCSLSAVLTAVPLNVYTRGGVAVAEAKLARKGEFTLVEAPAGKLEKPAVTKYAMLKVPASIKKDPKEHTVEVGLVLSEKGRVLATCIVSSDCSAMEPAAERQVKEMQFSPATLDGAAVPFFVVFPISYRFQPAQ